MRISLLAMATLIFFGALGFCGVKVDAQERGGFDPVQMIDRIFENDKDGDEKIAKDEATERMRSRFETIDTDEDGFLTKDEVKAMFGQRQRGGGERGGFAGGRGGMEGRGGPVGPGSGPSRMLAMMPIVIALDKNKDGELSKEEIDGAVTALLTLDKDKDGKISNAEMAPNFLQMNRGGRGGGMQGGGREGRGAGGGQRPRRPAVDDGEKDDEEKDD
jgi:hypothetical protein